LIALALVVGVLVVIGGAAKGFQPLGGKACRLPSAAMAERPTEISTPARVQRAFTFAAATLVAVSGGLTATAGAARGHAHVDTTPTPMVTQRMLRGYFNAIRDDDKRTDCRMYRIPGCSDRTSLRLAAAVARALVP
jgi:hypothetical protein